MNLSDLSSTSGKIISELSECSSRYFTVGELSEATKINRSTIHSSLQRLVMYELVNERCDISHAGNRKEYRITKKGVNIYKKKDHLKKESPEKNHSIVQWLRLMSSEFTKMADDLEIYEK